MSGDGGDGGLGGFGGVAGTGSGATAASVRKSMGNSFVLQAVAHSLRRRRCRRREKFVKERNDKREPALTARRLRCFIPPAHAADALHTPVCIGTANSLAMQRSLHATSTVARAS